MLYVCMYTTQAVITVPAGFSMEQKKATIEAGHQAGLSDVHLITEPAAGRQNPPKIRLRFEKLQKIRLGFRKSREIRLKSEKSPKIRLIYGRTRILSLDLKNPGKFGGDLKNLKRLAEI